jgi:hypothetical protein
MMTEDMDKLFSDLKEYVKRLKIPESKKTKLIKDVDDALKSNSIMQPIKLLAIANRVKKLTGVK